MQKMKKFMQPNTLFGRTLVAVIAVFAMFMAVFFIISMIRMDFPIFMVFVPIFPFALFAFFAIMVLRKSNTDFGEWWDSLSEYERADFVQDFQKAQKVDPILMLGERYAFIRNTRIPLRYEEISDVRFIRSRKNAWTLIVETKDGRKHVAYLTFLSSMRRIEEELMSRCGIEVFDNYDNDFPNWF